MRKKWLGLGLLLVALGVWLGGARPVAAASLPARPSDHYYYDDMNLLDSQSQQLIDTKNQTYQQTKQQPQIAVAVVKSSGGEALSDYAPKLFSKWGIGDKSRDNGVLIVFAENQGAQNMRIEVGYGLEGELTDVLAKNILNQNLKDIKATSHAKINTAIRNVFNAVATVVDKKYKFKADKNTVPAEQMSDYRRTGNSGNGGSRILTTIVSIFIGVAIIVIILGSGGGPRGPRGGRRGGSWWLWWLLGSLMSGGSRNRWGGGGYGGGSGFGGGGFGGGSSWGGGSSGGGGADV